MARTTRKRASTLETKPAPAAPVVEADRAPIDGGEWRAYLLRTGIIRAAEVRLPRLAADDLPGLPLDETARRVASIDGDPMGWGRFVLAMWPHENRHRPLEERKR